VSPFDCALLAVEGARPRRELLANCFRLALFFLVKWLLWKLGSSHEPEGEVPTSHCHLPGLPTNEARPI